MIILCVWDNIHLSLFGFISNSWFSQKQWRKHLLKLKLIFFPPLFSSSFLPLFFFLVFLLLLLFVLLLLLFVLLLPYATDVTDVLLPKYYESCPTLDDTVNIQACINGCSSNANCLSGQKCCSIGCSTICRNVSLISYYPIPLTCPPRSVAVALSPDNISCIRDCQLNSQCSYRELCCTYGCSSSCQPGQMPARPCNELRRRLVGQLFEGMEMMEDARMSPVVDFVPQCDEMGLFHRVQEGADARWCVNVVTGAPTSDLVLNTSAISCPCEFCVVLQHPCMYCMYSMFFNCCLSVPSSMFAWVTGKE